MIKIFEEIDKRDYKLIINYLKETNQQEDISWVKKLINKIGITEFCYYFITWNNCDIEFIDLDKALLLYEE